MQTLTRAPLLAALAAGLCFSASALAATLDFESLADLESVGQQFAASGVTFSNAIALTAGLSVNEVDVPPHSGSVVISDDGGPMTLTFTNAVQQVGGFFTYAAPLTLNAYDAAGHWLGSIGSAFSNNTTLLGAAGSMPNEWLQLSAAAGMARLTISGDAAGGSFVLDDLSITPVPEPAAAWLLVIGLGGLGGLIGLGRLDGLTGPRAQRRRQPA